VLPPRAAHRDLFARHFRLRRACGLGFLWPQRLGRRLPPGLLAGLGGAELLLGRLRPFVGLGRFVLLELERRG
jgi:hypothetical protein